MITFISNLCSSMSKWISVGEACWRFLTHIVYHQHLYKIHQKQSTKLEIGLSTNHFHKFCWNICLQVTKHENISKWAKSTTPTQFSPSKRRSKGHVPDATRPKTPWEPAPSLARIPSWEGGGDWSRSTVGRPPPGVARPLLHMTVSRSHAEAVHAAIPAKIAANLAPSPQCMEACKVASIPPLHL
jgi:hypothetical protein